MRLIDYLCAKYGGTHPTTMLACEAKVFGVPYPLQAKWLAEHGDKLVTPDVADALRAALGRSKGATADRGMGVLREAHIELKRLPHANDDDFLSSKAWKRVRLEALKVHGSRCQCCGRGPINGAVLNVDHIKPRRLHPELALRVDNLQVLCDDCNEGKGNWDMTDFREPTE